jgi:hypothetical protein
MTEGTIKGGRGSNQRTQKEWIELGEKNGFKFIKFFKKNPIGVEDHYIFVKEKK